MGNLGSFFSWVGVSLITLLPIINPVATAALLLSISKHLDEQERNRQVKMACIYMSGILLAFLFAGHYVIVIFGISIPGIRIAGGLVICFLGFRMLFPVDEPLTKEGKEEAGKKEDISFSPLAMPSLSGPGAIAVMITMSSSIADRSGFDKVLGFLGVVLAILITAVVSWVVLRGATAMSRFLGVNGLNSLSKIMGFILSCIGIQFAINGVRDLVLDKNFWVK
jgi:multiple antibiotic resistance protein